MAVKAGSILVKIDLDSTSFSAKMTGATADLSLLTKSLGLSNQAMKSSERHVTSWGRRFRDSVLVLGLARHALLNLNTVILGFPRTILKSNAELEKMTFLMAGMSTATGGWENAMEDAKGSVELVFDLARTAPFEVSAITDSFVKLKASGIDPTNGSLQALIDSIAKFGGTSDHLKRASIAIQQMSGKGVISMEELRQQLGEAIPNAVMIMARSLNLSMGDLVDKISQGVVEAKSALGALFRQMEIENAGSALRMSTTMEGTLARLKTRFTVFYKTIGDAGFFDAAKESLTQFVDGFMISAEAMTMAKSFGEILASITIGLRDFTAAVYENWDRIVLLAKASAVLYVAWRIFTVETKVLAVGMRGLTGIFGMLASAQRAWAAESLRTSVNVNRHFGTTNAAARGLAMSIGVLGASFRVMASSLVAMAGSLFLTMAPLALFSAAIWLVSKAIDHFLGKKKDLKSLNEDFTPAFATDKAIEQLTRETAELQARIDKARADKKILEDGTLHDPRGRVNNRARLTKLSASMSEEDIRKAEVELAIANEKLALANQAKIKRAADALLLQSERDRAEASLAIQKQYTIDLEALRVETLDNEALGTSSQRREVIIPLKAVLDAELLDKNIALAQAGIEEYRKAIDEATTNGAPEESIDAYRYAIEKLREEIENLAAKKDTIDGLLLVKGSDSKSPFETWMDGISKKIAVVGANLEDVSPEFEKFMVMLDTGAFGEFEDGSAEREKMIADAKALTTELFKQKQIYDLQKEAVTMLRRERKNTVEVEAALSKKLAQLSNDNPFMQAEVDVEGFRTQLENTIETLQSQQDKITSLGQAFDTDLADGIAAANEQLERLNGVRIEGPLALMRRETDKILLSLMTDRERTAAEYLKQVGYLDGIRNAHADSWSVEQLKVFEDYASAMTQKMGRDFETPIQSLMRTWTESSLAMDQVFSDMMSGFVDSLVDGLAEGEMKFKDFTKSILKMILKIQLQKMIAGIVGHIMPGGPAPVVDSAQSGGTYNLGRFAQGGIMTSTGAASLRKYSKGGVANAPQFSMFGEGDDPEAYVPLPDGRRIPVNMTVQGGGSKGGGDIQVNVINQTSTPVNASEGPARFNGTAYVREIILTELSRPGAFRDSVRGK